MAAQPEAERVGSRYALHHKDVSGAERKRFLAEILLHGTVRGQPSEHQASSRSSSLALSEVLLDLNAATCGVFRLGDGNLQHTVIVLGFDL